MREDSAREGHLCQRSFQKCICRVICIVCVRLLPLGGQSKPARLLQSGVRVRARPENQ